MNDENDVEECNPAYDAVSALIDLRPAVAEVQRIILAIREEELRARTRPRWFDKVYIYFGCDPPMTVTKKQLLKELFAVGAWCYERGGKLAMRTLSHRVVETVVEPQAKLLVKCLINASWKGLYERAP